MRTSLKNSGMVLAGALAGIMGAASLKPSTAQMQDLVLEKYSSEPSKYNLQITQAYYDYHSLVGKLYESDEKKPGSPYWTEVNPYVIESSEGMELALDYNGKGYRLIRNGEGLMLESLESKTFLRAVGDQIHNVNVTFLREFCEYNNSVQSSIAKNNLGKKFIHLETKQAEFWNKILGRTQADQDRARESYGLPRPIGYEISGNRSGGNQNE